MRGNRDFRVKNHRQAKKLIKEFFLAHSCMPFDHATAPPKFYFSTAHPTTAPSQNSGGGTGLPKLIIAAICKTQISSLYFVMYLFYFVHCNVWPSGEYWLNHRDQN